MDNTRTSIIVVAADSGAVLRECMARALQHGGDSVEVILVDNGSGDGVPQAIERARSDDERLQVLYAHRNLGFGPAVNLAARRATGQALLIVNPDCLLQPDTLSELQRVLDSDPHAGLVGAVVCDAEGCPDPASRRRDPLLRRALRTLRGTGEGEGVNIDGPIPEQTLQVEAVSGALMLVSRGAFEHIGGFDEGYFLHCEDLDLCRRLRDARYHVLLAGQVRVQHVGGSSSRHRPVFVSWHKHRGMWRWFCKFDPAARNLLVAPVVWAGIWGHFLVTLPARLVSRRKRA